MRFCLQFALVPLDDSIQPLQSQGCKPLLPGVGFMTIGTCHQGFAEAVCGGEERFGMITRADKSHNLAIYLSITIQPLQRHIFAETEPAERAPANRRLPFQCEPPVELTTDFFLRHCTAIQRRLGPGDIFEAAFWKPIDSRKPAPPITTVRT